MFSRVKKKRLRPEDFRLRLASIGNAVEMKQTRFASWSSVFMNGSVAGAATHSHQSHSNYRCTVIGHG